MRRLLLALGLLTVTGLGQAKYAGTGPGSVVVVGATVSGFHSEYGQRDLGGTAVFVDLNPSWRYGIEGEARWLRVNQIADTHFSTYLVGPRISLRPHRLNPYAKALVGLGRFNFPYDYASGSYFVLAPGGGVDWRASERVRIRLVDFEYQMWPQFTFGAIHPVGVSAGFSFSLARSGSKRADWHSR